MIRNRARSRRAGLPDRLLSALLAAALALAAGAEAPAQNRRDILDAQARAEAEAEAARRAAEAARRSAEEIRAERERLAERIRDLGERIVAREAWLAGADDRVAALRRDIAAAEARLERARERLALLGAALQRIRREPTPAMLAHPDRPRVAARSIAQIRALLRSFEEAKAAARTEIDRIARVDAEARDAEAAIRIEREALQREIAEAEALLEERRRAETAETTRAAVAEARAAQLAAEAESLGELAASVSEAPPAPRERQPAAPAIETATAPVLAVRDLDIPFAEARGRLLAPAAGELRRVRNPDGAPGAILITRPRAQVIAPWRGVVRFAGTFESHRAVIIEPETGYAILLTGLGEITAREGDEIEAGQLIGRMPGSAGSGGQAREELYIEVFDRRAPLDPIAWFE